MSRDPIGFEGGDWNLYEYVGNEPVDWIDEVGYYRHKQGGPYHPKRKIKTKCTKEDTCGQIEAKILLLDRMIWSHIGWELHHPPSIGHRQEIGQFITQLNNCEILALEKCGERYPCPRLRQNMPKIEYPSPWDEIWRNLKNIKIPPIFGPEPIPEPIPVPAIL